MRLATGVGHDFRRAGATPPLRHVPGAPADSCLSMRNFTVVQIDTGRRGFNRWTAVVLKETFMNGLALRNRLFTGGVLVGLLLLTMG